MKQLLNICKKQKIIIFAVVFLVLPFIVANDYWTYIFNRGFANAIAVIGLVILYGMTGQVSLGNMAFFAIGAYTSAVLTVLCHVPTPITILAGILTASIFGALISLPSFKLTGPFLSISTVAFGEIVRLVILNLYTVTGGPSGMNNIPTNNLFGLSTANVTIWYFILFVVLLIAGFVGVRIKNSHYGRAFYSVKEDEIAASLVGVRVKKMKTVSFTFAAFLCGVAGALYAHFSGFLSPDSFASAQSFNMFSMAVMGGTDSVIGSLWSSVSMTLAPELLRFLKEYYMLFLNLLILLVLLIPWNKQADKLKTRWIQKTKSKGMI